MGFFFAGGAALASPSVAEASFSVAVDIQSRVGCRLEVTVDAAREAFRTAVLVKAGVNEEAVWTPVARAKVIIIQSQFILIL